MERGCDFVNHVMAKWLVDYGRGRGSEPLKHKPDIEMSTCAVLESEEKESAGNREVLLAGS